MNLTMLGFLHESPRFLILEKKYEEAFHTLDYIRWGASLPKLTETEKREVIQNAESAYSNKKMGWKDLFEEAYRFQTIWTWVLWFVVNYIFYGVIYLIPELLGKSKSNITYKNLIKAVVFSTLFEIIGILCTFIMYIS